MRINKLIMVTLAVLCMNFILVPIFYLLITTEPFSFLEILKDKEFWASVQISFLGAFCSSIIGLFMGLPFGFLVARKNFPAKSILESITFLPIVIPHVAVGIMLLCFFSKIGIPIVDTVWGIIVAMCFVSISYSISSCIMGFRSVDPELEWTARSLGASASYTFFRITLPLVFPYIARGFILSFARALSEVGAILIIAYYPKSIPVLIYERFENFGLRKAVPITSFVILLSLFIFSLIIFLERRSAKNKEKKYVF